MSEVKLVSIEGGKAVVDRSSEAVASNSDYSSTLAPTVIPEQATGDDFIEVQSQTTSKPESTIPVAQTSAAGGIADLLSGLGRAAFSLVRLTYVAVRATLRYVWCHPIHALFSAFSMLLLAVVITTGSELHQQMILSRISNDTINQIIQGSRFSREYQGDQVTRDGTREFVAAGAPPWVQREGVRAILYNARKAGLATEDQAVLLAIADIESGFNPMAHAGTTSACGLFQFVRRTGEMFNLTQTECMDPWKNAESAIAHFKYNLDRRIRPQLAELRGSELVFRTFELSYYLHHDGSESSNPSNEVKAIILSGTRFLFTAYRALQHEAESQQQAPSFSESFTSTFWGFTAKVAAMMESLGIPVSKQLAAVKEEAPQVAS